MRALFSKKNLLEGIRTASHAISGRTALPILGHVLLSSEETTIRISGTDHQIGVSTVIPAQVLTPGEVTLPASVAAEIVGAFPEADVVLESDDTGSQVRLACPPAEFNLVGLPPGDFPGLPEVPDDVWFEMDAGQLRAGLTRTLFACSTDELRAALTGVLFELQDGALRLVSTDTYRLAVQTLTAERSGGAKRAIVPRRAAGELMRLLPDSGSVRGHISGRQAMFQMNGVTLTTALIDALYPNYERVIPRDFDRRWVIATELLAGAVRRAGIVARRDDARVTLSSTDGGLTVSAQSTNVGNCREELEAGTTGDLLEIAFNSRYLLDALNALDADHAAMEMSGPENPAVLRPEGRDDYLCVVMPMSPPGGGR